MRPLELILWPLFSSGYLATLDDSGYGSGSGIGYGNGYGNGYGDGDGAG